VRVYEKIVTVELIAFQNDKSGDKYSKLKAAPPFS
jgi:hypothetical protein